MDLLSIYTLYFLYSSAEISKNALKKAQKAAEKAAKKAEHKAKNAQAVSCHLFFISRVGEIITVHSIYREFPPFE